MANKTPGDLVDKQPSPAAEKRSSADDIAAFVAQAKSLAKTRRTDGRGRLIFALDATMSRQPTWDIACQLQAEMFAATTALGGLQVQLVYFRGFGECRASKWAGDARQLADMMTRIDCRGGHTQIGKVLQHARREAKDRKISALIYVGDAMEENIDDLCDRAGKLALLGVPAFIFQEGHDPVAENAFREIARLTGGAFCRFDAGSADQLRTLLSAVAVYAAGGRAALEDYGRKKQQARVLLTQMR
jgi:hypothetical protein